MKIISDYLTKDAVSISSDSTILKAIELMREKCVGSLLIKEGDETIGIFTERDLLAKIDFNNPARLNSIKIKDMMSTGLRAVDYQEPAANVIELIRKHNIRHIPVVKDDCIIGVVSLRDFLNRYQEQIEQLLNERETQLRDSMNEIAESEERFRTVFENSAVAIIVTDEQERIILWNKFTEKLLNMHRGDLYLKPVSFLYPKQEWKRIRSHHIRPAGLQHHLESVIVRKGRSHIEVDISISVLKDSSGKTIGSIGIIKDITEHKQAERSLKESEEKFRTIFENSAVAITVTDKDECIVAWNPFAAKLLGMNGKDLRHKPVKDLYPPAEWKKIRSRHIRQFGMEHHMETKVINKQGKPIDIDISISVLKDAEGNLTGSIGIIRDVTERKKAEEERLKTKALQTVKNMMVTLNHRMNSPLVAVVTYLNLLIRKTEKTHEDYTTLTEIKKGVDKLNSILQKIQSLEKVESTTYLGDTQMIDLDI